MKGILMDNFISNEEQSKKLSHLIGKLEMQRLFSYEYCELEPDFLGFLNSYYDLQMLSKNFTIIDIGCYQALQAVYFRNHKKYIGVDNSTPTEYRLRQENAEYYCMSGQMFIKNNIPKLLKNGLDIDKTFVICSYVPDKELWKMISETFPYHRVKYCDDMISEKLPIR